jgi:hypothetical protein
MRSNASSFGIDPHRIRGRTILCLLEPRGNPLWLKTSLAPRGSAASLVGQMDLVPNGADGRALLFRLPALPEQKTHHAPKAVYGRATGLSFERHQPVRL